MAFEPAESLLKSRSYIGLVLAQFLAAFNDQAIHFVAIFYAGDMLVRYVGARHINEASVITIVTACFIAPFFFFSPLAGVLADKYSKRNTLVFWKYAEVGITTLALCGFLLPHTAAWGWGDPKTLAACGAGLVIAAVFMMGTHSAFFVPAKYGIMPEILHTSVLSRGNGLLEGTSFTANILGTAFGGFFYDRWKSTGFDTGQLQPGHEWIIGLVLLGLAVVGTVAAQLIAKVPAAAPNLPFIWQPWIPLQANWEVLRKSRPLVLATIGIAFFTFMTLFLRQTLIFQGEYAKEFHQYSNNRILFHPHEANDLDITDPNAVMPSASSAQKAELRVAMLVALVGLGVGIGCALAGMLSGDRIELGLVPVGAFLMTLLMALLAWVISTHRIHSDWPTGICLIFVGVAAGLYIVPMYTWLQHRAPKDSKGGLVAMSNFLNVSGGLIAIAVFSLLTGTMQSLLGLNLSAQDVRANPMLRAQYVSQLELQLQIPRYLFVSGGVITLLMLIFFVRARPDFLLRTLSYFRVPGRKRLHAIGLTNVPANGQLILATNCHGTDQWMQVLSALDRGTRYVKGAAETTVVAQNEDLARSSADQPLHPYASPVVEDQSDDSFLETVARRAGVMIAAPVDADSLMLRKITDACAKTLQAGNLLGLAMDTPLESDRAETLFTQLQARVPSCVLPVHCGAAPTVGLHLTSWRPVVAVGKPLPPSATPAEIRAAIEALGEGAHREIASATHAH